MIVNEIRIKTASGHKAVSLHVLCGAKNEQIRILEGGDFLLADWMQQARRHRLHNGLRHIAFSPELLMTDQELEAFAIRLCTELHANPEKCTLVIHVKNGKSHGHLLLPEWQGEHVLSSRYSWMRLEKIARLEEIRLNHPLVPGRHDAAIARQLRKEGHLDAANKVAALIPPPDAPLPRAAYTSQARRMAERQGIDLVSMKKTICDLWGSSGKNLAIFRHLLSGHNLRMREGDRQDTRTGAHIIETIDGQLIGSFTRLTKLRMKEFRILLQQEQPSCPPPSRESIAQFIIPQPCTRAAIENRILHNKPLPFFDRPRHSWVVPALCRPDVRKNYRLIIRQKQACYAVLNAHPTSEWGPFEQPEAEVQRLFRAVARTRDRYRDIKRELEEAAREQQKAQKSWLATFTNKRTKADENYEQLTLQLMAMIQYLFEIIMHWLGLRSQLPTAPRFPIPTEKDAALQNYCARHKKFRKQLDDKKLFLSLLRDYCKQAREKHSQNNVEWYRQHYTEREKAKETLWFLETISPGAFHVSARLHARIEACQLRKDFDTALALIKDRDERRDIPHRSLAISSQPISAPPEPSLIPRHHTSRPRPPREQNWSN